MAVAVQYIIVYFGLSEISAASATSPIVHSGFSRKCADKSRQQEFKNCSFTNRSCMAPGAAFVHARKSHPFV